MNDASRKEAIQKLAKKKFGRRKTLESKVAIKYKKNLEREYVRLVDQYMDIYRSVIKKYIPVIMKAIDIEQAGVHTDDKKDLSKMLADTFRRMDIVFEDKTEKFGLQKKLDKLSSLTRKLSVNEWKRVVKNTVGVDIMDDYYLGEFYRTALSRWTDSNVNLVKTIPKGNLSEMQTIIKNGFENGLSSEEIAKEIEKTYNTTKSHARFIARDQMAKLNAELAQSQQTDAGIEEYIWSSCGDGRVRDRHKELDGKVFKWSEPPVVDKKTGRRCHPGEDYRCRCIARPVFKLATLDLPVADKGGDFGV